MTKARCCAQAQFFKNDPMFEQMVSCINMNDYRLYPLGASTRTAASIRRVLRLPNLPHPPQAWICW
jgi:hypothetical protein